MKTTGFYGLIALAGIGACYRETPYYATPAPYQPQAVTVSGPPGGEVDPGSVYEAPGQPGYPAGYPAGVENDPALAAGAEAESPEATDMSGATANPTGTVTDAEIDATLAGQGQWIETEEYGRVWRPDATVVGVNFTPYESCGRWVYTEFGWTFQSCEEWSSWGWLAFHYGQWDWYDGGWCWVPDYYWSPAWVDWRYGGGYVGWRPQRPRYRGTVTRDHRRGAVATRDYRSPARGRHHAGRSRDADWRFTREGDLGRHNLRGHLAGAADGLRATSEVARPPLRGNQTVSAATLMRNRQIRQTGVVGHRNPNYSSGRQSIRQPGVRTFPQPGRPANGYRPPRGTHDPRGAYNPSARPRAGGTYNPPSRGAYDPPSRGTYNPPSRGTYNPPSRGTHPPSRGTYNPPSRGTYNPPSRGTYNPPSRSYNPPSRSHSPPSRASSPSRSYSPPSRSYSPPSRSSSPSRSYSPSRSSSSHSSSSSRSSSSHSSSSRSSGSSSHSSGSRGGGRHR